MIQPRIHTTARIYVNIPLRASALIALEKEQSHYLAQVLRKKEGEEIRLFNGRDGEWKAVITQAHKKELTLQIIEQLCPQSPEPDIWLAFAPIKNDPLAFMIEKSTELGVSAFLPVFTQRTVVHRINTEKLSANILESSEQCERLTLPALHTASTLDKLLEGWPQARTLLVCDEMGTGNPVHTILTGIKASGNAPALWGILIGPEGGFTDDERALLKQYPFVTPVGLGPRILRADTAAIAALSCLQSIVGDWHLPPRFHFL